jgi:hypothetical protein
MRRYTEDTNVPRLVSASIANGERRSSAVSHNALNTKFITTTIIADSA